MAEIILYQYAGDRTVESMSPFCAKVHRALAYKRIDYVVREVASPMDMRRINPGARKVPVLSHDGELVTDSTRILDFIEARHPSPSLWPADGAERAQARLVEDWADEALYWFAVYSRWGIDSNFEPFARQAFAKMPLPLRWFVPRMVRRTVIAQLRGQGIGRLAQEQVWANLDGHLEMLASLLGDRAFLVGGVLSAADIAVFAPLRALALATAPEASPRVRRHPALLAWLKRVDEVTTGSHTVAFDPA